MIKHAAARSSARHSRSSAASAATIETLAALVENDDDRAVGNDIGERDRFLDTPTLGILGAAFANFDDFDVAQAERAAGRFRALAVRRGELALGSLFQPADGGDDKAHGCDTRTDS